MFAQSHLPLHALLNSGALQAKAEENAARPRPSANLAPSRPVLPRWPMVGGFRRTR